MIFIIIISTLPVFPCAKVHCDNSNCSYTRHHFIMTGSKKQRMTLSLRYSKKSLLGARNANRIRICLASYGNLPSYISAKLHVVTICTQLHASCLKLWLYIHAGITSYEKSDHHTYIPMSILAIAFAVVTVLVLIFYNWMAPRPCRPTFLNMVLFFPEAKHHTPSTEEGIRPMMVLFVTTVAVLSPLLRTLLCKAIQGQYSQVVGGKQLIHFFSGLQN